MVSTTPTRNEYRHFVYFLVCITTNTTEQSAQLYAPSRRPAQEMKQRNTLLLHESFFSLKGVQDRPVSVATEFMESDFEEDDILSDDESVNNGGNNSPRGSMNSVCHIIPLPKVSKVTTTTNHHLVRPAKLHHHLFLR